MILCESPDSSVRIYVIQNIYLYIHIYVISINIHTATHIHIYRLRKGVISNAYSSLDLKKRDLVEISLRLFLIIEMIGNDWLLS